jgi:hypothetical protein
MDVVNDDAAFRHLQPFVMFQRVLGVLVAALPMFAHRCAGEIMVLRVALIGLLLIDQVQDIDLRQIGELSKDLLARALAHWLQEERLGGLPAALRRQLAAIRGRTGSEPVGM